MNSVKPATHEKWGCKSTYFLNLHKVFNRLIYRPISFFIQEGIEELL